MRITAGHHRTVYRRLPHLRPAAAHRRRRVRDGSLLDHPAVDVYGLRGQGRGDFGQLGPQASLGRLAADPGGVHCADGLHHLVLGDRFSQRRVWPREWHAKWSAECPDCRYGAAPLSFWKAFVRFCALMPLSSTLLWLQSDPENAARDMNLLFTAAALSQTVLTAVAGKMLEAFAEPANAYRACFLAAAAALVMAVGTLPLVRSKVAVDDGADQKEREAQQGHDPQLQRKLLSGGGRGSIGGDRKVAAGAALCDGILFRS